MIRRHPTPSAGATTGLRHRKAEASGKAAADCAALCCCCPCSVMNLVVLAVYRIPAGLCRRMAGKRRRGLTSRRRRGVGRGGGVGNVHDTQSEGELDGDDWMVELLRKAREEGGGDAADQMLEQEMWERFNRTGFGRSTSTEDS